MKNTEKKVSGFRPETIKKIVASLVVLVNMYLSSLQNGKKIDIVISNGNRKIGRCMNVSLAPIITCGNCRNCKYFCYDVKACCQYENVRKARAKNTALFRFSREEFFAQLWVKMSRKKTNKFLRFHVPGEIADMNHFEWIVETARRFPDFRIWTYTKMYWIVNAWIAQNGLESLPENLSVMFSEWKGVPIDNPYGMPVFRCIEHGEEESVKGMMQCPGCCDHCKKYGCGCVNRQSAYVYLH